MAALPYMQLYVADYLADTMHLDCLESGAYLHLLMNYWQTGKALEDDDRKLARIAKCSDEQWLNIRSTVVQFFTNEGGKLVHGRVEDDLEKVRRKSRTASKAGKASGVKRRSKTTDTNGRSTDVQRTLNHTDTDTDTDTDTEQIIDIKGECSAHAREGFGTPSVEKINDESEHVSKVMNRWSEITGHPPSIVPAERLSLAASIGRNGLDVLMAVLDRWRKSPFLRGEQGNWSGAPLNWLWDDERIAQILRGQHDGTTDSGSSETTGIVGLVRKYRSEKSDDDGGWPEPVHGRGVIEI